MALALFLGGVRVLRSIVLCTVTTVYSMCILVYCTLEGGLDCLEEWDFKVGFRTRQRILVSGFIRTGVLLHTVLE